MAEPTNHGCNVACFLVLVALFGEAPSVALLGAVVHACRKRWQLVIALLRHMEEVWPSRWYTRSNEALLETKGWLF